VPIKIHNAKFNWLRRTAVTKRKASSRVWKIKPEKNPA